MKNAIEWGPGSKVLFGIEMTVCAAGSYYMTYGLVRALIWLGQQKQ